MVVKKSSSKRAPARKRTEEKLRPATKFQIKTPDGTVTADSRGRLLIGRKSYNPFYVRGCLSKSDMRRLRKFWAAHGLRHLIKDSIAPSGAGLEGLDDEVLDFLMGHP